MITVGLTYDLKDEYLAQGFTEEAAAEFDVPETIDALENSLVKNGYRVERIGNLKSLVKNLAAGKRWDIVFNICEGVKGVAREAQVPALLEAFDIPCVFSNAAVMVLCLDKSLAKRVLADQGIPTAKFSVIQHDDEVEMIQLTYPLFVKPVAEGTGKGIGRQSYITDKDGLKMACRKLLAEFRQPVLVEEYLPGRDLTVGIVGSGPRARVIGVMETFYLADKGEYEGQSYHNKMDWKASLSYALVNDAVALNAADIALRSWRLLGCTDGGRVDLRCDYDNVPHFLEVNPLAGMRPGYSDFPMLADMTGVGYDSLIGQIMTEACHRCAILPEYRSDPPAIVCAVGKKVVILYSGEGKLARQDENDTLTQLREIGTLLRNLHYHVYPVLFAGSAGDIESRIRAIGPDCVFNLVESVENTDRLQYSATAMLDYLRIPYTGAATTTMAMLSSKIHMKVILQAANIPTPKFYSDSTGHNGVHHLKGSRWIVKSDSEHASVGLDAKSVVNSLGQAKQMIQLKEGRHGGRWFAEQFIDGREFNLAMLGAPGKEPHFLPPAEIVFQDYPVALARIVDYAAKWEAESFGYQSTQRRYDFGPQDMALLDNMREICLTCWELFRMSGAARVDFRVSPQGVPYVVDINSNPCLSSDAGYMAAAAREGLTLADVVKALMPKQADACFV